MQPKATYTQLHTLLSPDELFLPPPPKEHKLLLSLSGSHSHSSFSTGPCTTDSRKLHSAGTKLSFVHFFLDNNAVCFPRGRAERSSLAAALPRSPVSLACHPLCVCSDVCRALSATGLCLFWAALVLIMAH